MGWTNAARVISACSPAGVQQKGRPTSLLGNNDSEADQNPPSAKAQEAAVIAAGIKLTWVALWGFIKALWLSSKAGLRYLLRHPLSVLLNAALIVALAVMLMTGSEIHKQMILGKISGQTVDRIIQSSDFTRDFDATRDGSREFYRVGAPDWIQKESIRAILYHARKANLPIEDQAVLLATAEIESGFNPMARAATTTACGVFQFVQRTGQLFELSPGECMNPWLNARSGIAHYLSNYEQSVRKSVTGLSGAERVFRTFELSYYLHHDGPRSSNPSNDLKATVLSGTQFLFKAYHVLQEEALSEQKAPSFMQIFSERLWSLLDRMAAYLDDQYLPSLGLLQRAAKEGSGAA